MRFARPVYWWEKPDAQGRQGRIVSPAGRDGPVACPACGDQPVVYNGNYFCDGWGVTCDWALPHPARKHADRAICDLLGIDHA